MRVSFFADSVVPANDIPDGGLVTPGLIAQGSGVTGGVYTNGLTSRTIPAAFMAGDAPGTIAELTLNNVAGILVSVVFSIQSGGEAGNTPGPDLLASLERDLGFAVRDASGTVRKLTLSQINDLSEPYIGTVTADWSALTGARQIVLVDTGDTKMSTGRTNSSSPMGSRRRWLLTWAASNTVCEARRILRRSR